MTTLRKELREALQWCIKRRQPFQSVELQAALDTDRYLANRKLLAFVKLGLLERSRQGGSGTPYTYTICDRGLAESLANETPIRIRTRSKNKVQVSRSAWAGASSIFHMGA